MIPLLMKKPFLIVVFLFTSTALFCQTEAADIGNLITDRPDQTESPFTLPQGFFQWETGFLYTKGPGLFSLPNGTINFTNDLENYTFNTSLLRYGITDRFELRLIQEIGQSRQGDLTSSTEAVPTLIGTKIHVLDQDGMKPQIGFLAHFGGPIFSSNEAGALADFRFNFEHQLNDKLILGYNLGGRFSNDFNDFTGLYTLVLGYNITPKLYSFVELYGFFPEGGQNDHQIDYGVAYVVSPNFQLDVFAGTGFSDLSPDSIFGFGFSLRIPKN